MRQTYHDLKQEMQDRMSLLKERLVRRHQSFKEMVGKAHIAIGVRRCGKTYLMYEKILDLLESGVEFSRILYLNLEDDRLQPKNLVLMRELLDYFYQNNPKNHDQLVYFFFDEIQEIEEWSALIRRLLDTKKCEIYLTGSSAKLLSKEIATNMRGRSLSTEVWPFDFSEYLSIKKQMTIPHNSSQKSKDIIFFYLRDYLLQGGFPEITLTTSPEAQSVLQEYVDVAIFRDIVERHAIKNIPLIRHLVRTLLCNVATTFSINKIYNDFKSQGYQLGKETLYHYLGFIDDCYMAFSIPLYSDSLRKVQVNARKIYACDTGMATAFQHGYSENLGRLFENMIYLELRRRGAELYYYKTREGYEIDFVAVFPGGQRKLYQVAWDVTEAETLERETRALDIAKSELGMEGVLLTPMNLVESEIVRF